MHTSARPSVSNRTVATSAFTPLRNIIHSSMPSSKPPHRFVEPRVCTSSIFFDIIRIFRINVREIKNQIYAVVIDYKSKPVLGHQLANNKMKCLLNRIQFPSPIDPLLSITATISTAVLAFSSPRTQEHTG